MPAGATRGLEFSPQKCYNPIGINKKEMINLVKDLTKGTPWRVLLSLSLPMLVSVAFQQMYNIADSVIAGNWAGEFALSEVGASYPVTMIFLAIATGGSAGASVVAARLFGAKEHKQLKTAIYTALITFTALAVFLTVIGSILCTPMLELLGTPKAIMPNSDAYLRIYILGLTFLFLYNACNGIFTALGDSKTPLYFLIGSSVGNVLLDLLFVLCFNMGVAGVAWATFIAQGISSVLSVFTLLKRVKQIESEKPELFSKKALLQITRISVPSILQSSFVSVGNLFIQSLVNFYGTTELGVIGGYSAAIKLNTFALTCFSTLSNSVSNYAAQNMGAGRFDRVKKGVKSGAFMSFIVAIPFAITFFFFGGELTGIFATEGGEGIIRTGRVFLQIASPFYLVICFKIIIDGVMRGLGIMKPFVIATCLDLVLRVAFAYILSPFFGSDGIWMSWPVGWLLALFVDIFFYRYYIIKGRAIKVTE